MQAGSTIGISTLTLLIGTVSATSFAAVGVQPLVGSMKTYTVRRGDNLLSIARHHNLTKNILIAANPGAHGRLKKGAKLKLPSQYILPRHPQDGIVLNVAEKQVYLFEGGAMRAHYPVAVGKRDWPTALGTFTLTDKKTNPIWHPTKELVYRAQIKDEPVPPGKENPLGDRWMGWSKPGFGFHSTVTPGSVGSAATHGCARLYPESAHAMYDRVKVGMTIYSVYEPVEVGRQNGKYFLSVFPDIYKQNLTTLPHVQKILTQYGLLSRVNPSTLKRIVQQQKGIPELLIGRETKSKPTAKPAHHSFRP